MPLRDILVLAIVFVGAAWALKRPWIGVLLWSWIGYMNPHRLTWGIAYSYPVAMVAAIPTLIGLLFSKEDKRIPMNGWVVALILLNVWMIFTTFFAFAPDATRQLDKVLKIQLFVFVTLMLMKDKERIHQLLWVIVISIGFYGVKGGRFTVMGGGGERVWGPAGSFIADNNALALAIIMVIPFMRYLQLVSPNKWVRWGLGGAMALSAVSAVGSHSRGGFLAIIAMGFFLWIKTRNKLPVMLAMVVLVPLIYMMLPEHWFARMETIQAYEEDSSAMGRIHAWIMAWNLALDRPFVGGGFNAFIPSVFAIYGPEFKPRAAHSIWFQMLGEHGFVGFALYVVVVTLTWQQASRVMRSARGHPEWTWAYDLGSMVQVSLVGFMVGGTFLSLPYWDLPYHIGSIMTMVLYLMKEAGLIRSMLGAPPQKLTIGRPAPVPATGRSALVRDGRR